MPCPRCDTELALDLAGEPDPVCPACGLALLPARTATCPRRLAAACIDALVVAAVAVPIQRLLGLLVDPAPLLTPPRTPLGALLGLVTLPVGPTVVRAAPTLLVLYTYLVLHWAGTGRTVGGRLLGVGVVDRWGRPPGPGRTLVRAAAHALGGTAGLLGWVFAAFEVERRAFHDKIAGTWVVRSGA